MSDIAAGNVTYSFNIKDRSFLGKMGFLSTGSITFGNGSLTYPAGGVPVTKAKCGAPRRLRAMKIFESNATGYQFEYDLSAETIRIFQTKTLTPVGTLTSNSAGTPAGNLSTNSAGTPAGNLSSNSAGTPSGNLSSNSAGTPAGNVAAPTITIISAGANAAANAAIFVSAGALKHNVANASSVTGVQAPVFTGDALAEHGHTYTGDALAEHGHVLTGDALAAHGHTLTGDALAGHAHSFAGSATTASVMSELSGGSSAVAACVLQVEVLGY